MALYTNDKILEEVSDIIVAHSLEERKQQLLDADFVIFTPGGAGTLDELAYDCVAMQDGFLDFKPFFLLLFCFHRSVWTECLDRLVQALCRTSHITIFIENRCKVTKKIPDIHMQGIIVFNKSRIMSDTSCAAKVHIFSETTKRNSGKATAAAARASVCSCQLVQLHSPSA